MTKSPVLGRNESHLWTGTNLGPDMNDNSPLKWSLLAGWMRLTISAKGPKLKQNLDVNTPSEADEGPHER